jgi:hypothetical protein
MHIIFYNYNGSKIARFTLQYRRQIFPKLESVYTVCTILLKFKMDFEMVPVCSRNCLSIVTCFMYYTFEEEVKLLYKDYVVHHQVL